MGQATGVRTQSQLLQARTTDSSTSGLHLYSRTYRGLTIRSPMMTSRSPKASAGSERAGGMTEVLGRFSVVTRNLGAR